MALALIEHLGRDHDQHRFRIELGSNAYYAYAIGQGERRTPYGFRMLEKRFHTSPLHGPLDPLDEGHAELRVPADLFDREHASIQLLTFRTARRAGPTYSRILSVLPFSDEELPSLDLSCQRTSAMSLKASLPSQLPRAHLASLRVRPRPPLSSTQFLQGLVSLLPSLLPAAGSVIQGLLGGGSASGGGAAGGGSSGVGPQLTEILRQVLALIERPAGTATAPPPNPATARTAALYSEACIAPALLAALPSLMPLLQNVLSPQTIQSVLQTADPNRLIGTVSQAVNSLAQLGLQANQQEMNHLEKLNPGVDDPALMQLLASMSLNLRRETSVPRYRRADTVRLRFEDLAPITVGGRPVVAVVRGEDLVFPLSLETPRAIPKGRLHLLLKEAESLEVVASRTQTLERQGPGELPVPTFPGSSLSGLKPGSDYLVCATLTWKNKSGQILGATMTQLVTVLDALTFDSVREAEEPVALNDVDRHRDFWHKVWQDGFSRKLTLREYECKYYVALDPSRPVNGQLETQVQETEKGLRRVSGRLKSGLILSLERLNALLPELGGHPTLDAAQLNALRAPAFVKRLRLAARTRARFQGAPGASAALWAFPEVRIQTLLLKRVGERDAKGHVRSLLDELVRFPMPTSVHLLGASS